MSEIFRALISRIYELIIVILFTVIASFHPDLITITLEVFFAFMIGLAFLQDFKLTTCLSCCSTFRKGEMLHPYTAHNTPVCPICDQILPTTRYDSFLR